MKTYSYNGIGTLSNSLSNNVIVNILDVTSFSTELILLHLALLTFLFISILLVLLNMIC